MQQFVSTSYGRDLRMNIVGNEVVCAMIRENQNDFRSNITIGGKAANHIPAETEKNIALRAAKALDMDFCAVDMLFGKDGNYYICEVNSNPHFKSSYDATGVNLADKIFEYILRK